MNGVLVDFLGVQQVHAHPPREDDLVYFDETVGVITDLAEKSNRLPRMVFHTLPLLAVSAVKR